MESQDSPREHFRGLERQLEIKEVSGLGRSGDTEAAGVFIEGE